MRSSVDSDPASLVDMTWLGPGTDIPETMDERPPCFLRL